VSVQLLRASDRVPTPWRNGGGITREIAVWPPGATLEEFDWRVSMAEVRETGPFSRFPGVDRVLTILQGTLALTLEGRPAVQLTADSLQFHFPGDAACVGEPIGGPVLDLNVMIRRDCISADVRRISHATLIPPAATCLLVALSPEPVTIGTSAWHLAEHDVLLLQGETGSALTARGASALISLSLR
jgi:environmental stress-induced protein Ves